MMQLVAHSKPRPTTPANGGGKDKKDDLDNGKKKAHEDQQAAPEPNHPQPLLKESGAYIPVPFMLFLHLSILLAAVSRAFPSAHLAPHVSVYNACRGLDTIGLNILRITGGLLATLVVTMYYCRWYMPARGDKVHRGSDSADGGAFEPDPPMSDGRHKPVTFRSELLRVPLSMVVTHQGERRPHSG